MIVVAGTQELAHLRRALAAYVYRRGADRVPRGLLDLLDDFDALSSALDDIDVATFDSDAHPALMSFTDAAAELGVSNATIGRMARRGDLEQVGRRIVAASVHRIRGDR